jgi:hypothetical protein
MFAGVRRRPDYELSGENRGSSPLGSANNINGLHFEELSVSRPCPVEILGSWYAEYPIGKTYVLR